MDWISFDFQLRPLVPRLPRPLRDLGSVFRVDGGPLPRGDRKGGRDGESWIVRQIHGDRPAHHLPVS